MILSFHPNIVAEKNILCAGRPPDEGDRVAISQASAVILPQGCSEALYRMCREHCPHVFPNYDVRFDFPGKLGQARLFQEMGVTHPPTLTFETVTAYDEEGQQRVGKQPFTFPCVFKSDWGGEGEGVFLIRTPDELETVLARARDDERSGRKGFLLQTYIPSGGRSLRVAVIGDQFFSYWRAHENPSQFLVSVKNGAVVDHHADPELQEIGKSVVKAFCSQTGINLAGFDLLFSQEDERPAPFLLEINYFFGRRGLGGSLNYYKLFDRAARAWLKGLELTL